MASNKLCSVMPPTDPSLSISANKWERCDWREHKRRALKFDGLGLAPRTSPKVTPWFGKRFRVRNPIAHPNHNRTKDVAESVWACSLLRQ